MGQIIFLNPFGNDEITGGIKTTYVHAYLLRELGFNVVVLQPDGPPTWLNEQLQSLAVHEHQLTRKTFWYFQRSTSAHWQTSPRRKYPRAK